MEDANPKDYTAHYMFGAFLLFCLSVYMVLDTAKPGAGIPDFSFGYTLAYYTFVPLVFPFAVGFYWLLARTIRILMPMVQAKWDALLWVLFLVPVLFSGQLVSPGTYAPVLWALLLFRVPYETLRPSFLYLAVLCWLPGF